TLTQYMCSQDGIFASGTRYEHIRPSVHSTVTRSEGPKFFLTIGPVNLGFRFRDPTRPTDPFGIERHPSWLGARHPRILPRGYRAVRTYDAADAKLGFDHARARQARFH